MLDHVSNGDYFHASVSVDAVESYADSCRAFGSVEKDQHVSVVAQNTSPSLFET